MKHAKQIIEVYGHHLHIVVVEDGDTTEKVVEFIHEQTGHYMDVEGLRYNIVDADKSVAGGYTFSVDGVSLVVLRAGCALKVLVHESYHVVCGVMRHAGVEQCRETEEAYAHLIGYVGGVIGGVCYE